MLPHTCDDHPCAGSTHFVDCTLAVVPGQRLDVPGLGLTHVIEMRAAEGLVIVESPDLDLEPPPHLTGD